MADGDYYNPCIYSKKTLELIYRWIFHETPWGGTTYTDYPASFQCFKASNMFIRLNFQALLTCCRRLIAVPCMVLRRLFEIRPHPWTVKLSSRSSADWNWSSRLRFVENVSILPSNTKNLKTKFPASDYHQPLASLLTPGGTGARYQRETTFYHAWRANDQALDQMQHLH